MHAIFRAITESFYHYVPSMSIQAPFLLPQPYSTRSGAPSRSLHQAECVWRYSPSHAVISELHNASHGVERQSEHHTTFLLFCNPNYSLTRTCTFDATHFPLCYHNTSPIISVYHRHQVLFHALSLFNSHQVLFWVWHYPPSPHILQPLI
jgi:hypothetical protein